MKILKTFLVWMCLVILVGCSTTPVPEKVSPLSPPNSLLKKAPELEEVTLDSLLDIIVSYMDVVQEYYKVLDRYNGLIDWITKMENKHGGS